MDAETLDRLVRTGPKLDGEEYAKALATLVRDGVSFIEWSAGEGFAVAEDVLFRFSEATGDEDWETMGERLGGKVAGLASENADLRRALHDAITRPMGVVPDSALPFYDPERYDADLPSVDGLSELAKRDMG